MSAASAWEGPQRRRGAEDDLAVEPARTSSRASGKVMIQRRSRTFSPLVADHRLVELPGQVAGDLATERRRRGAPKKYPVTWWRRRQRPRDHGDPGRSGRPARACRRWTAPCRRVRAHGRRLGPFLEHRCHARILWALAMAGQREAHRIAPQAQAVIRAVHWSGRWISATSPNWHSGQRPSLWSWVASAGLWLA